MTIRPRRLTFQLVSLFDLLIIVVFAQYLDLQDRSQQEIARAESLARSPDADAQSWRRKLDSERQERGRIEAEALRRQAELAAELEQSRDEMARLVALVADLFNLSGEDLEKVLRARSSAEADEIRQALKRLAAGRSSEAARHVLTLAELEKRCDIWQVHVREDNSCELQLGDRPLRIRADDPERFAAELFRIYKGLPQPKSLVLILVSWGDASLQSRRAAIAGVEIASDRMRADSDRRSRFEYAILGFLPGRDR
jgi:hypothetical protein